MLDTLFTAIKAEYGLIHMGNIMLKLDDLINMLHDDYLKDGNAKDACLDALISLIEQHKTKV